MNYNQDQNTAVELTYKLHARVKSLANAHTNSQDCNFRDEVEVNGKSLSLHYDARDDECHRGITIQFDNQKYSLWFECKGWVEMDEIRNSYGIKVYSQKIREDIEEQFTGDLAKFIEIGNKVLATIG